MDVVIAEFQRARLVLVAGTVFGFVAQAKAQDVTVTPGNTAVVAASPAEMLAPVRSAVEKGLKFLATRQLEDGAFSTNGYGRNAAVVALAGMAWLSGGSTPGRGPFGTEIGRAADYL